MKTNYGSRLDKCRSYQSDIVTMHGSTYIAVRICTPLRYISHSFYVNYHWKLIVIGWIFAYIILLYLLKLVGLATSLIVIIQSIVTCIKRTIEIRM
jgi:hypothetical protein